MTTVFLRVIEAENKSAALLDLVRTTGNGAQRYEVAPASFESIPGQPFAYWVSDGIRALFKRYPKFASAGRTVKQGLATADDYRFMRTWWEVPAGTLGRSRRWPSVAKGGEAGSFYCDFGLVVNWETDGRELKAFASAYRLAHGWGDQWSAMLNNTEYYFRPGFTYPLRSARFTPQIMPSDVIISVRGSGIYFAQPHPTDLLALMASSLFDALLKLMLGRGGHPQFDMGDVAQVPVPEVAPDLQPVLGHLATRAYALRRSADTANEVSHAFTLPGLLQVAGTGLAARASSWSNHVRAIEAEIAAIQAQIDERCFDLYNIEPADRRAITMAFVTSNSEEAFDGSADDAKEDDEEDRDERESAADLVSLAADLVSWAVGIAVGRFDVRLATGARPMPSERDPFDALPACSPGMITGEDCLPLAHPPAGYPLAFPESGALVDDLGHAQDLPTAVRAVFEVVFGRDADNWWNEVAALLDPKGHDLRAWLAHSFFEHHLKRHSKARRKAPIVWQLGTLSGRYSVWLHVHRLTRNSLFEVQNELVSTKVTHEERLLTKLADNPGGSPSAARKELSTQEAFLEELRAMLDEVKRVASLWNPNLDDGVIINFAPLWRLVPQNKAWQKELKATWDALGDGEYDWAHLAMHLWPERVVPKCAGDRSLAIAHGLEDVFWEENADGKWKPRPAPTCSVSELVAERSSPAVKAALKSLLEAPAPGGAAKRARKGRANASSA